MSVLIFANGVIEEVAWLQPYLAAATAVIAADGGTRHLFRLQHRPDVVIGDMDSLPAAVCTWLEAGATRFITHPTTKDQTDLELALLYAAAMYDAPVLIFGALGGRLDQTVGNILLLTHPQLHGRLIMLVTAHERAWLVRGHTEVNGRPGDTVSLIPLGGDAHIHATTGLQWPLRDEVLTFGLARGMSNVLTAVTATLSVTSGCVLCIHASLPESGQVR